MIRRLFYFFIDGIGLGRCKEGVNPITGLFKPFTGLSLCEIDQPVRFPGGVIIPTDAVLGVDGIPQSATGQTSLFTGINAPELLGFHLTAFPNQRLLPVIAEHSIMRVLREHGKEVTSANLYSREYFQARARRRRNMFSATTLTIKAAEVPFRLPEDFTAGRAVFADITGDFAKQRGFPIPIITPEEAAKRLLAAWEGYDFIIFEYFMTDKYGHKRDRGNIAACVDTLNRFLSGVLERIDPERDAVLIVSDHGNAEDITTGNHTLNRVPCIFFSRDEESMRLFEKNLGDLTDTYRAVVESLTKTECGAGRS